MATANILDFGMQYFFNQLKIFNFFRQKDTSSHLDYFLVLLQTMNRYKLKVHFLIITFVYNFHNKLSY